MIPIPAKISPHATTCADIFANGTPFEAKKPIKPSLIGILPYPCRKKEIPRQNCTTIVIIFVNGWVNVFRRLLSFSINFLTYNKKDV
jgi:hypothetical protein